MGRAQRAYWEGILGTGLTPLALPFDRPAGATPRPVERRITVPFPLYEAIVERGRREGVTAFREKRAPRYKGR